MRGWWKYIMFSITLSDGLVIENLELNGNNFISSNIINDDIFIDNLGTVKISDGETESIYENMKLIQNIVVDGKSWFILAEKTQAELEKEKLEKELVDLWDVVLFGGAE